MESVGRVTLTPIGGPDKMSILISRFIGKYDNCLHANAALEVNVKRSFKRSGVCMMGMMPGIGCPGRGGPRR